MSFALAYMDKALGDLREIRAHLSRFYPQTAARFLDALEKKTATLADAPYAFPEYEHRPAYRKLVVSEYVLLYKVDDEHQIVAIHRILHGARNIRKHL